MKKIFLLTIITLLVFAFFITGCKKEETIESVITNQDIDSNIDELIKKTGIDIYALASSPELLKYFKAVNPISEVIAENMDMRPSKSLTEEEKIARMNELVELISQAAQNNDFELVDVYFKELVHLLYGSTHAWANMDIEDIIQCELIQSLNEEVVIFNDFLTFEYPSFFTLDNEQQRSVINAIVEITYDRQGKPRTCAEVYADDIRAAEIQYGLTVAGCCLFGGPAAWACVGVGLGIYCVQHRTAQKAYADCINS